MLYSKFGNRGNILSYGKRLKEFRKSIGLSQQDFASSIGFQLYKIRDIEVERLQLTPEIAELIQKKYSLNGWWLLTGEGEMFSKTGEAVQHQSGSGDLSAGVDISNLYSRINGQQVNDIRIDNKKIFDYVQKKLPSIFEKVANADPRTLSQDDRDIEDFLGRITEIHLVQCVSDTNSWAENVVFAFMFLDNQQLIYVPSGYMNFMNGGHSGLIPFGRWLQKRSLMGKLSLKHVEYDLFRAHLEKSEYTADVIEIPEYTDRELAKEYFKSFVKGERWGDKAGELF